MIAFGPQIPYSIDMDTPRRVVTVRSELPMSFILTMSAWFLATVAVALFAQERWLWVSAAGASVGTSFVFLWAVRPRKGELERLILDLERRIIYWAHRGGEPEEVPFDSLKAIALEPTRGGRVKLHAVERTGRWVPLGQGRRREIEQFAESMCEVLRVPLWYRTGGLADTIPDQRIQART